MGPLKMIVQIGKIIIEIFFFSGLVTSVRSFFFLFYDCLSVVGNKRRRLNDNNDSLALISIIEYILM